MSNITILNGKELLDEIETAYKDVEEKSQHLYVINEALLKTKDTLEKAKLSGLADGTIDGKNAEMREASAREVLRLQYEDLEADEEAYRAAKYNYDFANLKLEQLRLKMRLLEVLSKGNIF